MNRKKFMAAVMSVSLALSNVGVYGAEFSDFSSEESHQGYQNQIYETETQPEDQQEIQSEAGDSDTAAFQDEMETSSDLTEFTDEALEISDDPEITEQSEVTAALLTDGDNVDENGFQYEYHPESDTYCLVKGADIENVVIPYQYKGKLVSEVGEKAFYGCADIKTVEAEKRSIRNGNYICIDRSAFENCKNLRKITLLQGAKLESRAFYNCPKLWRYEGVGYWDSDDTQIKEDSFDSDTKMIFDVGEYGISASVQNFADKYRVFIDIIDNENYSVRKKSGVFEFEPEMMDDSTIFCTDYDDTMQAVNVCVDIIGRKAFYGCSNVRKVVISSQTTTEIETKAFAKCKNMSIVIPASVTSISEDAFEGASGITIYADKGSYAEKYAKKYGMICKKTPVPAAIPVAELKLTYNTKYGDATLSWTPVDYVWSYGIYRYDAAIKKYKAITWLDSKTTSYKVKSAEGKTEKYKVCAMSKASVYSSQYSKKSNTVTVQGRPKGSWFISKKKKGKNFTFKWKKIDGAQGYILYRYDEKAREYKKIKTIKDGNVTTYTDRTGKLDKSISYRIRTYCITKDGTILYGF